MAFWMVPAGSPATISSCRTLNFQASRMKVVNCSGAIVLQIVYPPTPYTTGTTAMPWIAAYRPSLDSMDVFLYLENLFS